MSRSKTSASGKLVPSLLLSAVIMLCVGAAGLWLGFNWMQPQPPNVTHAREPRRDFALVDTSGAQVTLDTYRGKWLVMFFGFTSCPEACPLAMINVADTMQALGQDGADVQPIFVSVDPEHDTTQVLKDYLLNFGDGIVGLTGTPEAVAAVAKSYGVFYRKRPIEGGGYTVDHSTAFYLVGPDGTFLRAFTADMDPADFAQEIKDLKAASAGAKV